MRRHATGGMLQSCSSEDRSPAGVLFSSTIMYSAKSVTQTSTARLLMRLGSAKSSRTLDRQLTGCGEEGGDMGVEAAAGAPVKKEREREREKMGEAGAHQQAPRAPWLGRR